MKGHSLLLFHTSATQWGFNTPDIFIYIESAVKSMKKLLAATWNHCHLKLSRALLSLVQYCNTSFRRDRLSPVHAKAVWPPYSGHPASSAVLLLTKVAAFLGGSIWASGPHTLSVRGTFYNAHAHPLTDIEMGSTLQWHCKITRSNIGTLILLESCCNWTYHIRKWSELVIAWYLKYILNNVQLQNSPWHHCSSNNFHTNEFNINNTVTAKLHGMLELNPMAKCTRMYTVRHKIILASCATPPTCFLCSPHDHTCKFYQPSFKHPLQGNISSPQQQSRSQKLHSATDCFWEKQYLPIWKYWEKLVLNIWSVTARQ